MTVYTQLAEVALTKVYNSRSKSKKIWFIKLKESIKLDAKAAQALSKKREEKNEVC